MEPAAGGDQVVEGGRIKRPMVASPRPASTEGGWGEVLPGVGEKHCMKKYSRVFRVGDGFMTYWQYMRSDEWREMRAGWFGRNARACRRCGEQHLVELHHATYEHLGRELDADLVPLCRSCHMEFHRRHHNKLHLTDAFCREDAARRLAYGDARGMTKRQKRELRAFERKFRKRATRAPIDLSYEGLCRQACGRTDVIVAGVVWRLAAGRWVRDDKILPSSKWDGNRA
jgi:hypothetical protein